MSSENNEVVLNVGDTYISPSRTITESDVYLFAGITGDNNEVHTSAAYAEETRFQKRICHGLLVLGIANGLYTRLGVFKNSIFLQIDNWKFKKPTYIGDTIHLELTIEDYRKTSDGKNYIVKMFYKVITQNDVIVGDGIATRMIPCHNSLI